MGIGKGNCLSTKRGRKAQESIRGGVKEVNAEAECLAYGGDGVLLRDGAKDSAERGGSECDAADLKARISEGPQFQFGHCHG